MYTSYKKIMLWFFVLPLRFAPSLSKIKSSRLVVFHPERLEAGVVAYALPSSVPDWLEAV